MPTGIYQHKLNQGFQKGYIPTDEHRRKLSQAHKGINLSEETKRKISEANKGKRSGMRGKKHSIKTRKKMSNAKKINPVKYWFGKKLSDKHKKKISERAKIKNNIRKALAVRWKGHQKREYKRYIHLTNTKKYREWRMGVFLRDNFMCQGCGIRGCFLEAHHIRSWAKYPKERFNIENGVSLCCECHKLVRKKNNV